MKKTASACPSLTSKTDAAWEPSSDPTRPIRIAVIALPSFSNFTDFDALRNEPSVSLHLCRTPAQLAHADIIIVPGSKQTADDLVMDAQGRPRSLPARSCPQRTGRRHLRRDADA
jgi:cobyric acid synthase